MIVTIASGKGGTGKTTLATSLAVSLEQEVQLLDCDVEEPNCHLFLRPTIIEAETVTTPVPEVDMERCTLCGKCSDICQFRAISVLGNTVVPFHELCHSCGGCTLVCPEKAITETGRELGIIEQGHHDGVELVHGRLRVGEAMAPPLIRKVREYTRPGVTTIIDAPPGISCPVIAAVKGVDFVILVTEPTPFGLHDLELALGAVRILGIPCGLVINRADIGDSRVKDLAMAAEVPVLLEIPFDRAIAAAYSKGEIIAEAMPAWKGKLEDLYLRINEIAAKKENS